MPGEYLDLTSDPAPLPPPACESVAEHSRTAGPRRFVGICFECCSVYTRVYINREGTAYEGRCPRCAHPVRLVIGPNGTDARFFAAH